ncbi:MAG: cyclic nucleotide-binding domain-containing protein [Methylococcales bacterium]
MSGLFSKRQINQGRVIFTEGDPGDCAYIIEEGRVEITTVHREKIIVLSTLEPGDLFGEMSLIDGGPRSATARAVADCVLMVVTNEQVDSRLKQADPVLGWLLRLLLDHCAENR